MEKKQKISWGVSFGSIALVAGMVSYLGVSNGYKSNTQTTSQDGSNNQIQQPSFGARSNQNDSFNQSVGGNDDSSSSSLGGNDGSSSQTIGGNDNSSNQNDGSSQSFQGDGSVQSGQSDGSESNNNNDNNQFFGSNDQQSQFSNGGPSFGHHGGFDSTTGGT
ncbi:hypothetical protein HPT25_01480 [Bacillus sp. BRMEA1]|uniref:hypothetical protein n=1 Tax=Neobacillus endophyticus TaxID=2738405 RepID=UPI0015650608|nr:hypothetical protein [Neobacillus endophyticus]NRD76180.1 hypothetical protein [Neobacillus endophyticus]